MRTTLEIPDDLHRLTVALARSRSETLSRTVSDILRSALLPEDSIEVETADRDGLPTIRLGRPITSEDVAELDEEI